MLNITIIHTYVYIYICIHAYPHNRDILMILG